MRKCRYCLRYSTKNYKFIQNIPPFDKKGTEFPKNSLSDSTWTNTLLLFFYTPPPYLTKSLRLRHSSQNIKRQNSSSSPYFSPYSPIIPHNSTTISPKITFLTFHNSPQFPLILHLACPNATDNQ